MMIFNIFSVPNCDALMRNYINNDGNNTLLHLFTNTNLWICILIIEQPAKSKKKYVVEK